MAEAVPIEQTTPKVKYFGLQVGRGIAALLVVFHHSVISTDDFLHTSTIISPVLRLGYLGVDFFFVLSGYIIYATNYLSPRSYPWLAHYGESRMIRVFVPYLPVAVGLMGLYLLHIVPDAASRGWDITSTLTLAPTNRDTALSVAWTLRHELVFYFLFAAFKIAGRPILGVFLWATAILVIWISGLQYPRFGIFFFAPINLEFLFGVLLARLSLESAKLPSWTRLRGYMNPLCFTLSACLSLLFVLLHGDRALSPIVGLSFTVFLFPVIRADMSQKLKYPRLLIFLGNASYSIYLVHVPAISLAERLLRSYGYSLILVGGACFGIALGIVYHLVWEKPALALVRVLITRKRSAIQG